ncbi:MAG: peptide chain release factor 2 [Acidimicrobiia bacterium]|nr:peptide chain release factor 2 [Acidimicrobiia bacterium]
MRDFTEDLKALRVRLDEAHQYLRIDELTARQPQLEAESGRPDLWDDPDRARQVTGELSSVTADIELHADLGQRIEDAETLAELARELEDETQEPEIAAAIAGLARQFSELELRSLFSGEHDELDALVSVQAGEGGADAQDWAEMLERMFTRWAQAHGYDVEPVDRTEGSEAGISSAELIVRGRYAYGWLQSERGVHRLVRMSPFNAQGKRQTAFAALQVAPMLHEGDSGAIEIPDDEIEMQVFRASGAGGQHINKTSSAVRLIHKPTGIVVSCQVERSQLQNRGKALVMLQAKLAERREEERAAEMASIKGEQQRVGFGSQIRSYVLQPYQMVKDLRTEHETGNVEGVLDGDLDPFMEAWLRWQRASATAS